MGSLRLYKKQHNEGLSICDTALFSVLKCIINKNIISVRCFRFCEEKESRKMLRFLKYL